MKRYNSQSKNRSFRKSKKETRLKTLRTRDEEQTTTQETSIRNMRIKSAIEKGAESILPSDNTKGHCLKKFEHNGREGPIVVYAEDRKMFNENGHFTVITSFKPSDSLRNQLFFGCHTGNTGNIGSKRFMNNKIINPSIEESKNKHQKINGVALGQKHPTSFDGMVKRYKNRQEKYRRLLGDEGTYLFYKIDSLCNSKEEVKLERKPAKPVEPVLPKIVVDNKTLDGPTNKELKEKRSNESQLSTRLPYLSVSKYNSQL